MRDHHHTTPELPRHWITLPRAARERARRNALIAPLFPSHVGFFPDAGRHRIHRPEGLAQAIVKYCVSGSGFCELDTRRYAVHPGDLLVVPIGAPHAYGSNPEDPWTVYWFHAIGYSLPHLLGQLGVSAEAPVVYVGHHAKLPSLFQELLETLENDYAEPQLLYAAQTLTYLFGVLIRQAHQSFREAPSAAQRVLGTLPLMKQSLASPPSVAEFARLAHLSTSHYATLFRRLTGYAPKNYLLRLRLHRAAQLLDTTDHSVKAVAHQVGFDDPLHFSRAFRQLNGAPPSAFRQRPRF